ncbi:MULTISPECIES: DUF6174 domain-containing protein [unclassified Nocardioides]|uniref:DUF6174 domain-containing protein n=1 Tax=unclassified Nocardioides TaxID=2615069 RepID=UPI0004B12ED3|nr:MULTISPECIES: DUF6174 domain-containing protein [unclassified Nocardioides]
MQIRRLALPLLATTLALGATACGGGDDTASDPAERPAAGTTTGTTSDAPDTQQWPAFAPTDYTYRLEVVCFCPLTGPVEVTVADGEVASATRLEKPGRGKQAPEFVRLTINDIIDRANDPKVHEAEVTWPDGQDHPTTVAIDQIAKATDDEVTYTISDVRVGPVSGG